MINKYFIRVVAFVFLLFTLPAINTYAETNTTTEVDPMVVASENHTVALRNNGTVVVTGEHPFTRYESWTDIQKIVTDRGSLIGITSNGKILLDGVAAESYQEVVDKWENVKTVATNGGYMSAVKKDGTVLMTRGEVKWEDVVDIVPWFSWRCNGFLAITKDDAILYKDYYSDREGVINNFDGFTDIKKLATSYYNIVCLRNDGTVISYYDFGGAITERPWSNAVDVATNEERKVFALLSNGNVEYILVLDGDGNPSVLWRNMKALSAGGYHVVGIREDGKVLASGKNDKGQCNVESWDLTPLAGDANDDNVVNAKDALAILRVAAQMDDFGTEFIPGQWSPENAKLTNGSLESINAKDALAVLKIAAKIQ